MQRFKKYEDEFELISSANPKTAPRKPDKELLRFFINLLNSNKPITYIEEIRSMIKWVTIYGAEGYEDEIEMLKELCSRIDIL